jgi:sugar phosphate isomerase/epimerase
MYVSIRDDIVTYTGFPAIADGLRFFGLDAVELGVSRDYTVLALTDVERKPRLDLRVADDVKRLADQCAATGVRVSAFLMPNDFNAPDTDAEVAWIVRTVEVAAELGVLAVRIDAAMHGERELTLEERGRIFASGVQRVLAETKDLKVDLGIENHGHQGNDPSFLEGQMELVGSPRLGITMDTGNFYWAGHPITAVYEILERVAKHAKHTHVKNINYPAEIRNTRREVGFAYDTYVSPIPEGDIDHGKVVGYLKAAGYDRDLCIEDESLSKFDEESRRRNIRAAANYLRNLV